MIVFNQKMRDALSSTEWENSKLPEPLLNLACQGFSERNGCIFLTSNINKKTNASNTDFPDKTGYECFINSIHIDDHTTSSFLTNALLMANALSREWAKLKNDNILRIIISSDEVSTTIKFHLLRTGEHWLTSNLEEYEEAILIMDSIDCHHTIPNLKNLYQHPYTL